MESSYVLAGLETTGRMFRSFLNNEDTKDFLSREQISIFFQNTVNKFLLSYGQKFEGKQTYKNYNRNQNKSLQRIRDIGIFDKSTFYLDSGGFQISVGILNKRETELLPKLYYDYLEEYPNSFNKAFILDIPPGPGCTAFSNFDDVYNLNLQSYTRASCLPDEIRKKIIYIHHFRTPKLWDIYTRLMDENNFFERFDYHGTGGIVANMNSDMAIPCIIYVIPLIPLLIRAKSKNISHLNFHILGGANFRDILFYEIFKVHIKKVHNIDVNITYDSSGIFKNFMVGRWFFVLNKERGEIKRINLRTPYLGSYDKEDKSTVDDLAFNCLDNMIQEFDMPPYKHRRIYDPETGTFDKDFAIYNLMYSSYIYKVVEDSFHNSVPFIYELYKLGDISSFCEYVELMARKVNSGKISKKHLVKSNSIAKSLEMLTNLDENYCRYLVQSILSKDEFTTLLHDDGILKL